MSHPVTSPLDHPEICFGIIPATPKLMVRYSEISIPHTEFGIRESEFGFVKTGNSWCGVSVYRLSLDLIRAWSPYGH